MTRFQVYSQTSASAGPGSDGVQRQPAQGHIRHGQGDRSHQLHMPTAGERTRPRAQTWAHFRVDFFATRNKRIERDNVVSPFYAPALAALPASSRNPAPPPTHHARCVPSHPIHCWTKPPRLGDIDSACQSHVSQCGVEVRVADGIAGDVHDAFEISLRRA